MRPPPASGGYLLGYEFFYNCQRPHATLMNVRLTMPVLSILVLEKSILLEFPESES